MLFLSLSADQRDFANPQSHKSFRTKQKLAKAKKQNRPIPQWIRLRTGNTIRYDALHDPHKIMSDGDGRREEEETNHCIALDKRRDTVMLTDYLTATTLSGGTGARPVWVSKCIAQHQNATCCCSTFLDSIPPLTNVDYTRLHCNDNSTISRSIDRWPR